MNERIQQYLDDIEKRYAIKILLACETGSRGWGFPSNDSDYDVRLLYVHKPEWYFKVSSGKDFVGVMSDDKWIDLTGWELRKALGQGQKSNAALLERLQSPIIYRQVDGFAAHLLEVLTPFYSRKRTMHHYLSLAKKCLEQMAVGEAVGKKKFFYAFRSLLACNWIAHYESVVPMEWHVLLERASLNDHIKDKLTALVALKSQYGEGFTIPKDKLLFGIMDDLVAQCEGVKDELPVGSGNMEVLDQFLFHQVNG